MLGFRITARKTCHPETSHVILESLILFITCLLQARILKRTELSSAQGSAGETEILLIPGNLLRFN